MKKYLNQLKNISLFKSLKEEEIEKILTFTNASIKHFKKNEYIFHYGEKINTMGIILDGNINIISSDYWGNNNIISNLKRNNIFAEIFVYLKDTPLNVSVVTKEESTILFINIRNIIKENDIRYKSIFLNNLINIIAKKALMLNQKNELLSKRTTKEKIMSFLSKEALKNNSKTFKIDFSRQAMADFLAVDRSALSRELSKMEKEGLIKYKKNQFTLL